jgi:hypothetical protein
MNSRLLDHEVPTQRETRLEFLREHTAHLPFFDRYQAGDCEAVWNDLQGLGPYVREDPFAADGLAVAYETMTRARANIETIARRLQEMDYRFYSWNKPVAEPVLTRPTGSEWPEILSLEEEAGPLPFSFRAWLAIGGQVELTGVHPRLSFISGASREPSTLERDLIFTDPIVIYGAEDIKRALTGSVCFSDCDSVKANCEDGGDPYILIMRTAGADCLVHGFLNVVYKITFVQYLRRAFAWGGFPGFAEPKWARYRPPELDVLREGLLLI